MEYVKVFLIGGAICAAVPIFNGKNKINAGTVLWYCFVCSGVALGALGIYGPFIEFAGAGASVPLIGFGHSLWLGVKEAITNEGFIGIFNGRILVPQPSVSARHCC